MAYNIQPNGSYGHIRQGLYLGAQQLIADGGTWEHDGRYVLGVIDSHVPEGQETGAACQKEGCGETWPCSEVRQAIYLVSPGSRF